MKKLTNLLHLKRLYSLKNLGYNYTDLIDTQGDVQSVMDLPDTLQALRQQVANCHLCKLAKTRTNTVFGEGDANSKIVFVAEAPGETEDHTARPFVGRSGALLTKMIENVLEVKRQEVYITNILKCRPPNNATPGASEVLECKGYLDKQLQIIEPELVVALGATAFAHLTGQKLSITKARGEIIDMPQFKLIATYHPSYLLRNPSMKTQSYEDLLKIKSFL
ncbi:MAG: uracil-DNA glycosylase [Campylobacterota bacterium]